MMVYRISKIVNKIHWSDYCKANILIFVENYRMGKILSIIATVFFLGAMAGSAEAQRVSGTDEALLVDAVMKFNASDFGGAHKILSGLVERNPDNDAAHYYMALVRFALGNYQGAESALKKAVEIDRDNFWYRYRLAVLYAVTDRPELTISMYEQLLEDFPKKNELYYTLIDLYINQNEYDKAISTLSQIETVFGQTDMTAFARFDLLRMSGKEREGYDYLKKYNSGHASSRISSVLGDYYLNRYDKDSAMIMYNEALSVEPDYAPALLGIASIHRMNSEYDAYFSYVDRFISDPYIASEPKSRYLSDAFSPNDPYFLEAFRPQIDSLMDNAMTVNQGDSLINMSAAFYYYFTRRVDKALDIFKKNVRSSVGSKAAWSNYLMALFSAQRWQEYYFATGDALSRFSTEPYFVEQRGVACAMYEDYDEAIRQFRNLLSMSAPGDSAAVVNCYSMLGDLYHQKGEPKEGNKCYDKVLRLDPDNLPVLNNYAYYLSMTGKSLKKAAGMGKKCVDAEPDNPTYIDTYAWILHLLGRSYEAKDLFRHAMLYGGRESAVILDHYAEVLYSLGDKDLAFLYWGQAIDRDRLSDEKDRIPGLEEKVRGYKSADKAGKK